MANSAPDFFKILQILAEHEVDFIVVGGICAVLHGAPVSTFDLDIVHSRAPENIRHLILALNQMDACYRGERTNDWCRIVTILFRQATIFL